MTRNRILPMIFAAAAIAGLAACSSSGRDATITGKVRTVLQADRVVDASKIRVTTEKGVVTLAGSIAGEDAHKKAVELVARVEGVLAVRDRLDVLPAPSAPTEVVPAEPAGTAGSPALGGVLAEDGIRREPAAQPGGSYGTLASVVGPQDDVSLEPDAEPAVEPAVHREVPAAEPPAFQTASVGALGAAEAIAISLPDSPVPLRAADDEDSAITARVREALAEVGGRVQILTRGGVVILSGAVDTERERSEALRLARETKGVTRVDDRLIVLES